MIEDFLKKIDYAAKTRSKEIRLSIEDAIQISSGISMLCIEKDNLMRKVIELQDQILNQNIEIKIDGGSF